MNYTGVVPMTLVLIILVGGIVYLEKKLQNKVDLTTDILMNRYTVLVLGGIGGTVLLYRLAGHRIGNSLWGVNIVLLVMVLEKIYYFFHPIQYQERIEKLQNTGFEHIDDYYKREKIFNAIGIVILMVFILLGWPLTLTPHQVGLILIFRNLTMKIKGWIQSFILFFALLVGYLFHDLYFIIVYFEYMLLALFSGFLLYTIYKSTRGKKEKEAALLALALVIFCVSHLVMTNNRLVKDPQLQKVINEKYEQQFRISTKVKAGDPRLEMIEELNIGTRRGVRSLAGIENLPNLKTVTVNRQQRILDYSYLGQLKHVRRLTITDPHGNFSLKDLPTMPRVESLTLYFSRTPLKDEVITLENFPNLKDLSIWGFHSNDHITIDITGSPNMESMDLAIDNIREIVGLAEAENLKSIMLYNRSSDYREEIQRIRPDIEIK